MQNDREGWHLDKKVPISIIVVLLAQIVGGLWFLSKLDSRIGALESAKVEQAARDSRQDSDNASAVTLLRDDFREMRRDLGGKLDRLVESRK